MFLFHFLQFLELLRSFSTEIHKIYIFYFMPFLFYMNKVIYNLLEK